MSDARSIVCLSHRRWDVGYHRSQRLMSCAASARDIVFVEPPVYAEVRPHLRRRTTDEGVTVIVPVLPAARDDRSPDIMQAAMFRELDAELGRGYVLWLDAPVAKEIMAAFFPALLVYDVVDVPLAGDLALARDHLVHIAGTVVVGSTRLYQQLRPARPDVVLLLDGVDLEHFRGARSMTRAELPDSAPRPRIGCASAIDGRVDLGLVEGLARLRPDLHLIMVGPISVDPVSLPRLANLHWQPATPYAELPGEIASWDVAIVPHVLDPALSTTPVELAGYLAAGKPVVTTATGDVGVRWGGHRPVRLAASAASFSTAIDDALADDEGEGRATTDALLAWMGWDRTWNAVERVIKAAILRRSRGASQPPAAPAL